MNIKDECPYCFKALAVPVRAKIYALLSKQKTLSVSDIVKEFNLTQPTISYHLKEMENVGLIVSKKEGRKVFYSVLGRCLYEGKRCVITPFLKHVKNTKPRS
ncbi:MAG: metalloregulator ArsR/SmtB family transcription factor [Patescibacteria group bacterium]|nr:metalloregulator ArsR/SmtB family transcription factor [Patescibacteria group bacterium]